jgi:hypothetical protein
MTNTQYGLFEGVDYAEYDRIPALRFSALKHMERSPNSYRYHLANPVEPTAPMKLGTIAHNLILEGGTRPIAIWPGPGRRYGKEFDEWCKQNHGCFLVNKDEHASVIAQAAAVESNPAARRYLARGKSEVTMVWIDRASGRDCKARIDRLTTNAKKEAVLVSFKTTTDCTERAFTNQYARMCYAAQDAFYQGGYWYLRSDLPNVVVIAAETKAPHETAVYTVPADVLRVGQQQIQKWIGMLAECERTDKWPASMEGEQELSLPSWAMPGGDFTFDDLEPIHRD